MVDVLCLWSTFLVYAMNYSRPVTEKSSRIGLTYIINNSRKWIDNKDVVIKRLLTSFITSILSNSFAVYFTQVEATNLIHIIVTLTTAEHASLVQWRSLRPVHSTSLSCCKNMEISRFQCMHLTVGCVENQRMTFAGCVAGLSHLPRACVGQLTIFWFNKN